MFRAVYGQLRRGGLGRIAVTGERRWWILPDLPTVTESGVPGYLAVIHYGMVAPAGTSRAILDRLNVELRAALGSEDVRERIAEEGGESLPGTLDQQVGDIRDGKAKWGTLLRKLGIRSE